MVDALAAGVAAAEDARLVGPQRARHGVDGKLVEVAPRQVLGARAETQTPAPPAPHVAVTSRWRHAPSQHSPPEHSAPGARAHRAVQHADVSSHSSPGSTTPLPQTATGAHTLP